MHDGLLYAFSHDKGNITYRSISAVEEAVLRTMKDKSYDKLKSCWIYTLDVSHFLAQHDTWNACWQALHFSNDTSCSKSMGVRRFKPTNSFHPRNLSAPPTDDSLHFCTHTFIRNLLISFLYLSLDCWHIALNHPVYLIHNTINSSIVFSFHRGHLKSQSKII